MYRYQGAATSSRQAATDRRTARATGAPALLQTLQRTAGNQVTAATVQRAKTVDERAVKNRRVARAKAQIPALAAAVSSNLAGHCFEGKPITGGDAQASSPQGLHGYTNGQLPQHVHVDGTEGSPNKVHVLRWHWQDGPAKVGGSTMLPQWMAKDHALALMALARNVGTPNAADVRMHIQRGLTINFESKGANTWPTL